MHLPDASDFKFLLDSTRWWTIPDTKITQGEIFTSQVYHREILCLSTENMGRFFFPDDPTHFESIIFKLKGIYLSSCLKKEDLNFTVWIDKLFLDALFY